MKENKVSTALTGFLIVAVGALGAAAAPEIQITRDVPTQVESFGPMNMGLDVPPGLILGIPQDGSMNFGAPNSPDLSVESRLSTQGKVLVQTHAASLEATPNETQSMQLRPGPTIVGAARTAPVRQNAVSQLAEIALEFRNNGFMASPMSAGDGFDGDKSDGGRRIILPGESAPGNIEDDTRELNDLRQQMFNMVYQLQQASDGLPPGESVLYQRKAKEIDDLLKKIKTSGMPKETELIALREMSDDLKRSPMDPEAQKIKTYLSWLTNVPWAAHSADHTDLSEAKRILDRDHSGLEDVKKRVLEFLTVRKRTNSNGGGILLFIGPPGTGKTSIAHAIAESMGRRFVRFSLGGVADESNIRGHTRTYAGSQPGSIIRLMKQAGTNNPVMLLDEVDKMPRESGRGSAQPAFLEVLDPEQNNTFQDHYMEVPYDLSNVLFIVTANDMSGIPPVLLDRMEIIEFSGYTTAAKAAIIKNQILPKTAKSLGLAPESVTMSHKAADYLIENYTAEPGVRELQRQVSTLLRGLLVEEESSGKPMPSEITQEMLQRYLGRERYARRAANVDNGVGYASGLAVNSLGGNVMGIEVVKTAGNGKLILREKMKEFFDDSAHNAYTYVKSQAKALGILEEDFKTLDFDINVFPSTEIDGPSAGITMATALVSELTGRAVKPKLAMTGEIGLHGQVGAIGGLKDKVMAAYRQGYQTVIFPMENMADLDGIPKEIQEKMHLIPVSRVEEVFQQALVEPAASESQDKATVPVPENSKK